MDKLYVNGRMNSCIIAHDLALQFLRPLVDAHCQSGEINSNTSITTATLDRYKALYNDFYEQLTLG